MLKTNFLSNTLIEKDKKVIARPTNKIPLAIRGGNGAIIYDLDGNEYIDLTSGWNVVNTGWNHPKIINTLRNQVNILSYAPPWCTHQGKVELGESINHLFKGNYKVLCGSSGSESVETALRIARRATGRKIVVGFTSAYHGGTLGSMLASGISDFNNIFIPESDYHRYVPLPHPLELSKPNYLSTIKSAILQKPNPAAIILESVFTNPGVFFAPPNFYKEISETCKAVGALIIIDEIGTGFGRTGKMFGFENWPIQPDIICLSKAISSGSVPMAVTVMCAKLADSISGAGFSYTFGCTPIACAAAKTTLEIIIEENLVEKAKVLGSFAKEFLEENLASCKHVVDIRGLGLEIGIELANQKKHPFTDNQMDKVILNLKKRGIFIEYSYYTSTLLIMPPLVIQEDMLKKALAIIVEELNSLT